MKWKRGKKAQQEARLAAQQQHQHHKFTSQQASGSASARNSSYAASSSRSADVLGSPRISAHHSGFALGASSYQQPPARLHNSKLDDLADLAEDSPAGQTDQLGVSPLRLTPKLELNPSNSPPSNRSNHHPDEDDQMDRLEDELRSAGNEEEEEQEEEQDDDEDATSTDSQIQPSPPARSSV